MLGSAPLGGAPLGSSGSGGASATYTLGLGVGAFRLLGDGEVAHPQYPVALDVGALVLAGPDVFLLKPTYTIPLAPGAFALGGSVAAQRNLVAPLGVGQYGLAVQGSAVRARAVSLAPGALALTGSDVMAFNGYAMQAETGAFKFGGSVKTVVSRIAQVAGGTIRVTMLSAKARQGHVLQVGERAVALTGSDATFAAGFVMHLDPAVVRITRPAALLQATRILPAPAGDFALQVADVSPSARRLVMLRPGTFSLLASAKLSRALVAALPPAALVLAGPAPRMAARRRLTLGAGLLQATVTTALLRTGRGLALAPGAVVASPGSARLRPACRIALDPAQFAVSPAQALLVRPSRAMTLDPGSLALAAGGSVLDYSGSLGDLDTGLRWAMLTTITVNGRQTVDEFEAPSPSVELVAAATATPTQTSGGGGASAPQTYLINGEMELTVRHGLDYVPRVTVTDTAGSEYEADIIHGAGVVTVSLGEHITGKLTIGG